MKDYKKEILDQLLDKYEASKSFIGTNTVKQSFVVEIRKVFPEYADDSKVKEIQQINNDVLDLSEQSLIVVTRSKNGILKSVKLNTDKIDDCYKILKRKLTNNW